MFGDLHAPYTDKSCLTWAYSILEKVKGTKHGSDLIIIQIGDLLDFYCMSRFGKSQFMTPDQEIFEGRKLAEEFWRIVRKRAPRAKCVQVRGNHCIRPEKYAQQAFPQAETIVKNSIRELYRFPGVETIMDPRQETIMEGICVIHGHYTGIGKHVRHNLMNTIHGHTHTGGTHFHSIRGKTVWELDVGHMIDPTSKVASYTSQRWVKWTQGIGLVTDLGPQFVPFLKIR